MKQHTSSAKAALDEERVIASLSAKFIEFENTELLGPIIDSLRENIKPGICLICIEDVERNEAIWTCGGCFCILHLVCIQRWAKDSISNIKEAAAQKGFNLPILWCCPKCRGEYDEDDFPSKYTCFCRKVVNPPDDAWNSPHSCGDVCSKQLKNCEHFCSLLCHSGPCPQCPKQVTKTCFCELSDPRTLRCYAKDWSCGGVCSKDLLCGFHKCHENCHASDCPKCEVPITLNCKCSSPKPVTLGCADLAAKAVPLSCGDLCGKRLHCGIHSCKQTCHEGGCKSCFQSCPCGKQTVECSGKNRGTVGWEKSCGETCQKLLDCGEHSCQQKCHSGSCGMCLELKKKRCKCGTYENEVQCSKESLCTTRCGKLKNCGLHTCNKKCCGGDCAYSCSKLCDKTLKCKNHKCAGVCGHRGPCFPCPVSAPVKCRCGETVIHVPCGSERRAKPPSCSKLCNLKTRCDHPQIQSHKCHFGDCPRCSLPCTKKLECIHHCIAKCHTLKTHRKSCPPCPQLVPTRCPLHVDTLLQCSQQESPCQETCGKILGCGVHGCMKKCHVRIQEACGECHEPCGKERSCEHECGLGCHSGACEECILIGKTPCHCGEEILFVPCYKKNNLLESQQSCKNQCSRKLSCGHRCLQICHSGECSETERCRRKVKLSCKCRRLKKELDCFMVEKKTLECVDPPCTSAASPKVGASAESPNGQLPRKRNRKKKTSESDAAVEGQNGDALGTENKTSTFPLSWVKVMSVVGGLGIGFWLLYVNR